MYEAIHKTFWTRQIYRDRKETSSCQELCEIEIPVSVEEIGGGCFNQCSLSRVTFGSGSVLKRIGKLREIEIPASVEAVGNPGLI